MYGWIVKGIKHRGFDYTTSKSQQNPGSSKGWTYMLSGPGVAIKKMTWELSGGKSPQTLAAYESGKKNSYVK
jgi:hypothetical protein